MMQDRDPFFPYNNRETTNSESGNAASRHVYKADTEAGVELRLDILF